MEPGLMRGFKVYPHRRPETVLVKECDVFRGNGHTDVRFSWSRTYGVTGHLCPHTDGFEEVGRRPDAPRHGVHVEGPKGAP